MKFDVSGGMLIVLVPIFVVEIRDIDENVQHVRADVVLELVRHFLVVVGNVEFSDEIK